MQEEIAEWKLCGTNKNNKLVSLRERETLSGDNLKMSKVRYLITTLMCR